MNTNFEPLDLKHKQMLDDYFRNFRTDVSEFNFTEMFIWRKIRNTRIGFINDNICVFVEKNNKKILYRPFGINKINETIKFIFDNNLCDFIYGYLQDEIKELNINEADYEIKKDRDNFDYVYLTDDLINLQGRKYDGKRNHLKKFKQLDYKIMSINKDILPEVIEFQKKWCEDRLCEDDLSLKNESMAVNELLMNFDKLSVFGIAIFIEGKVQGYTIATELNKETAVIIVEKANPNIKGIYQGINQIFAEKFLFKYKYINREQDAGNEGLRKAKMSYHPNHFVEKTILIKKKDG
ncbi:MAG: phosphatidylglycerol lysyltransferase domain-containing protein [Candidatus Goldbacteria bacterium]|nr:phosphatidylglycerol lysyltransferase domain-containing protein [Candidatus Goldiibacteriota bacterium]